MAKLWKPRCVNLRCMYLQARYCSAAVTFENYGDVKADGSGCAQSCRRKNAARNEDMVPCDREITYYFIAARYSEIYLRRS
jgi:hypothetical protein